MKYNKDEKRRNEILAPYTITPGAFFYFQNLPPEVLETLIAEQFADPEINQNDSPTIGEFLAYMKEHPGCNCHGYAVSIDREDYRVSLEGLDQRSNLSHEAEIHFLKFCHGADEINTESEGYHAWWD